MNTALVWLLIAVSDGSYNRGNVTVVERFSSVQECVRVQTLISQMGTRGLTDVRCIQASVVVQTPTVISQPTRK